MLKYDILLLALFVSVSYCRSVTFKVIGFGSNTQLKIGEKKYTLKKTADEPYFSGKLNSAPEGEFTYSYIVDNQPEEFERICSEDQTETFIEFFGRKDTVKPLGQFQYPYNDWNRSIGKTELFDDSYIPTVHFYGNVTENFFHKPSSSTVRAERVTFYLKNSKKSFTNVPMNAKNKDFEKFQIKMSLSKKSSLGGRYLLKFRNGSEDPINLRQTIYGNINQAIGIPSIHSVMIRVYYNMKPVGFYTLQEEAVSESFLRAEFYGDPATGAIDAPSPFGDAYDCSTGGDFEYKPNNQSYYDPLEQKIGDNNRKIVALTKAIEELDTTDEAAVEEFNEKWFDIDSFQKAMAMEYLTGDWDGYWFFTSNFVMFEDAKYSTEDTYKFYYITQDHDETFGVGITSPVNKVGVNFPKQSYTTMLNKTWHYDEYDAEHRTLVDKFIASTPKLQQRFQNTLVAIVQNIFNPVSFKNVVETYFERYQPEAEWDYSFKRPYTRVKMVPDWHYEDFLAGFNNTLPGLPWSLYGWVTLRAEALKNEFCITWEGDENPPDASCVPYIPLPEEANYDYIGKPTEIPEPTTTENVEPTTTIVSTITIVSTTTITIEEPTTTTEKSTTIIKVPTTTKVEEPTTTKVEETTTKAEEPTSTPTQTTKTLPSSRNNFLNWFRNRKPNNAKSPRHL